MLRICFVVLLGGAASAIGAQATPTPTECFGFKFGTWEPSLRSVASTYNPGYDPKASAPAGAPRDWAARIPNGRTPETAADSVLMLFPAWWPVGVTIEWKEQHGDTLVGIARAIVATNELLLTLGGMTLACCVVLLWAIRGVPRTLPLRGPVLFRTAP